MLLPNFVSINPWFDDDSAATWRLRVVGVQFSGRIIDGEISGILLEGPEGNLWMD